MIVKMHEASDGSLHKTFEAFAKHEEGLKITAAVSAAELNTDSFHDVEGQYMALDADCIGSFIADNAVVLRKILNDAVVIRRGRNKTK